MCTTAYEMILSFPEDMLSKLSCDLNKRQIFSRNKLIFSDGHFHSCRGAETLNSAPLIDKRTLTEEAWCTEIKELFEKFQNCFPRHVPKRKNFISSRIIKQPDEDTGLDFNRRRLALELYIMFHALLADFKWGDNHNFMKVLSQDCVIYQKWLI